MCWAGSQTEDGVETSVMRAMASKSQQMLGAQTRQPQNPGGEERLLLGDGKVGSQELPGVTGKFGLGVQNEDQRLTEFCQVNALVIANNIKT